MKQIKEMIFLTGLSSLMSCKMGSTSLDGAQEATLSAANIGGNALQEFCATAEDRIKGDFKTEIGYLCRPTKNQNGQEINLSEMMKTPYTGEGDPQKAIEIIHLSSQGKDTKFASIGVLKVKKNLAGINRVREKSLNMSAVDTQYSMELAHKVVNPPTIPTPKNCYQIQEYVKDPFGSSTVDLQECFYSLNDTTVVSYQGLAPKEDQTYTNASIFTRFEVSPTETLVIVVTRKKVNNKNFGSIAEGVIRGQAPQLLSKYFDILSQAPEAETVPSALSLGKAVDYNQINVTEDWSFARTKLSCKPDTAIYALKQTAFETSKPKALLQIECGFSMKSEALNSYRYEDGAHKILPDDEISCRDDEYAAGVSYRRYNDSTRVIIDGIKSLLCMKKKTKASSCTWRGSAKCEDGEYMKGVQLSRVGGWICDTPVRRDDDGTGCYQVKSVSCCK